MRTAALAISVITVMILTSSAYAAQFAFDPLSGNATKQADSLIPAGLVAIASLFGALIIVLERKKSKGIWFSNRERLK